MTKPRVAVGISGGVDSAVAAALLLDQGYEVVALFMKNWDEDDDQQCSAKEDLESARQVCERLSIELRTVNFSSEYWDNVFEPFLDDFRAGLTPNPDTLCNREIKFDAFLQHARALQADKIATGHYAGVDTDDDERGGTRWRLLRGADADKDQSYFLYLLNQNALRHTLFPLSQLRKPRVREIAKARRLPCHDRSDSTGICFIGERNIREFLSRYIPAAPGDIVDCDGRVVGQHEGAAYYTIGQRSGLGIGGSKGATSEPWYVADKDVQANRLTVVQGRDHPSLFKRETRIRDVHWIDRPPSATTKLTAKCRYRQRDAACAIALTGATLESDTLEVRFEQPQWALAAGQALVFYAEEQCLGGGVICAT